jgi:hypothetical protein
MRKGDAPGVQLWIGLKNEYRTSIDRLPVEEAYEGGFYQVCERAAGKASEPGQV